MSACNWWAGECTFLDEQGAPSFWAYLLIGSTTVLTLLLIAWRCGNPNARLFNLGHHIADEHVPLGPAAPAERWQKTGFWDSSDRDIRAHSKKAE